MNHLATPQTTTRKWPDEGYTRIPFWVYTDQDIFDREMSLFFHGKTWNYIALACEIPEPGDFIRSWVGTKPVIAIRDKHGNINVLENRCAHKGSLVCWKQRGNTNLLTCPYHQWAYAQDGTLKGVPFKNGALGKGGLPKDFDYAGHSMHRFQTCERNGVIWASYSSETESFEDYCGEEMLHYVDRIFPGKPLKLLGYQRQTIPCNWKMYFENLKDPYHATLLHTFYITFGLWRADSEAYASATAGGKHGVMFSKNDSGKRKTGATEEMTRFSDALKLNDMDTVTPQFEFEDRKAAGGTLFPSVVLQQQANSLAMRHLIPKSPNTMELSWTFFGYADDTPEMTRLRLRHANLVGPAGLVSIDDSEVLSQCQIGAQGAPDDTCTIEMGGREVEPQDHMITEVQIRGFYKWYREAMGL